MWVVKNELDEYLFYDLIFESWGWTLDRMQAYLFANKEGAAYYATLYDARVIRFAAE